MNLKNANLAKLRKQRKLTQVEAAKAIGIPKSTYAMLEAGHRVGSVKTLKKIADFFGVKIEDLLGDDFFDQIAHETRHSKGA